MGADMTKFQPPAIINKGDLTQRRAGRMASRRARPLTRIQEVLFVAAAFFVGGLLQMLAILYIGRILE
jgi:hypothetical protein